jgi:hypothetical protein
LAIRVARSTTGRDRITCDDVSPAALKVKMEARQLLVYSEFDERFSQ